MHTGTPAALTARAARAPPLPHERVHRRNTSFPDLPPSTRRPRSFIPRVPPHPHFFKPVSTNTSLAPQAPTAPAASPCVLTDTSATPLAHATAAPSPFQACVRRHFTAHAPATPPALSWPRTFTDTLRPQRGHVSLPTPLSTSVLRHIHTPRGSSYCRSFISCPHRHTSRADGIRVCRTTLLVRPSAVTPPALLSPAALTALSSSLRHTGIYSV